MFNPNQFLRGYVPPPQHKPPLRPSGRIILQKMTDNSKTRWDEPIQVPDVLFLKFKLTVPASSKQSKKYPISLIEYIRRAYGRCKDEGQSRVMEAELKRVIAKHQEALDSVRWEDFPLPNLQDQQRRPSALSAISSLKDLSIKKEPMAANKQYVQPLGPKEEAPPQTKLKVQSTLQKLQQKLSKKEEGKLQAEKKTFIGFKTESDVYRPSIKSEISPHLRTMFMNNPPPPPPPPPPQTNTQISSVPRANKKYSSSDIHPPPSNTVSNKSKDLNERFAKSSEKPDKSQILNVITSTTPEPIQIDKKRPSLKSQTHQVSKPVSPSKQKGKVLITRKQLSQITKAAQSGDIYSVAKRYQQFNRLRPQVRVGEQSDEDMDECNQIIVGRSTRIDKPYLRINGRPDADTVRPEPILKKALSHFLKEFKQATTPYDLLISQFKSIRQDLTVQHIRNSFTVQVYEENFRMSLFENDVIQVKHCQANLWQLYRQGLMFSADSRDNFISYHLITLVLEQRDVELQYMLTLLPQGTLSHPAVTDSLRLKKIFLLGNYRAFFDFCNNTRDEVCRKLLNIYIDKVRMRCLLMFSKTCGERVTFSMLSETVGQDEDVLEGLAVGEGAVVRQGYFMLKQSYQKLSKSEYLVIKKVTNLLI